MKNPYGIIMSYVFQNGRNDIIQLLKRHNLPFEPTPQDVVRGIKVRGIRFLHDFDVNIVRPYAKEALSKMEESVLSNAGGDVQGAAQALSSNAKNPNKGQNILAGLGAAFEIGNTIMNTVSTIKNNKNPSVSQLPTAPAVVYDNPESTAKTKDKDQTKTYLIIGGAIAVLILVLFLFMNKK